MGSLEILQGIFVVTDVSRGGSDSEGAEEHFVVKVDQVFQIDSRYLEGVGEMGTFPS